MRACPRGPERELQVAVDLAAVCDGQRPQDELTVFDGVHGAVVADSQPPPGRVHLEGFDVKGCGISLVQRLLELGETEEDAERVLTRNLQQVPLCARSEPHDVSHEVRAQIGGVRPSLPRRPNR